MVSHWDKSQIRRISTWRRKILEVVANTPRLFQAKVAPCICISYLTLSIMHALPFSEPFLFKEETPSEISCVNSCILEVYALNRELKFAGNVTITMMFVMVVHTPTILKCHPCHKLTLEICEQINSNLERSNWVLEPWASHFVFYLQFFIHHWNLFTFSPTDRSQWTWNFGKCAISDYPFCFSLSS